MDIFKNLDKSKITPEKIAILRASGLFKEAAELEDRLKARVDKYLEKFITQEPEMLKLKEKTRKLSFVNDPVLINGETGTGKELIAQALHGEREGQFVAINCAGLPASLMESELFGHVSGAFTGAKGDKDGLLTQAKNGTIFLDEIGDMPLEMQAKLLRAVQSMSIRKIGGLKEEPINCRFVSATHKDLVGMYKSGAFREDLFWRLSTFTLHPKPLSLRVKDIPLILEELDDEKKINIAYFASRIDPQKLTGNVRQLQQYVRRFYVLGEMPNMKGEV